MVASGRTKLLLAALMLPLLAACAPTDGTPHTSPTSTEAPTPRGPTTTPTLPAELSEPQIVVRADGVVEAIGIFTNQAPYAVEEVVLRAGFYGQDGQLIAQRDETLALPWLAPGASSPYRARYLGSATPTSARVEAISYRQHDGTLMDVAFEAETDGPTVEGGWRVVGTIRGDTERPALLGAFLLAAYEDGQLAALSLPAVTPHQLPAGAFRPFEAEFRQPMEAPTFHGFLAAEPTETAEYERLRVALVPEVRFDEQARPFAVGLLENPSRTPLSARLLLELRSAGSTLRVLSLDSAIPLAPGERRPFGLRLPTEPAELEIRTYLDERRPAAGSRSLDLTPQITSAERIGGSYFLRGIVRNPHQVAIAEPTIFAALRSTEGELWSAHWLTLADRLAAESERAFVLSLPLPDGIQVSSGEFDLRAVGLDRNGP